MPNNSEETDVLDRASSALNALLRCTEDNTNLALIRDIGARLKKMSDALLMQIIDTLSSKNVDWTKLAQIKDSIRVLEY